MDTHAAHKKTRLIAEALKAGAPLSVESVEATARALSYGPRSVQALFPLGFRDMACEALSIEAERLRAALALEDVVALRVRDRIEAGVFRHIMLMDAHRTALRPVLAYAATPAGAIATAPLLWRCADLIWRWAGDTSTDYNRYTKRALLSGVIASTILFWLNDMSAGYADTRAFLQRRIADVLAVGGRIGKVASSIKGPLSEQATRFASRTVMWAMGRMGAHQNTDNTNPAGRP